MKHLLVAACLICLPFNQALALSCAEPSIEGSFHYYSNAKETYILVLGELTNKRNIIPEQDQTRTRPARGESYVATFKGFQATRSGFDKPLEISVAVKGVCVAGWCGGVTTDLPMIAFFEETPYGYNLSDGPCGGAVFHNPGEEQTASVLQCLRGGVCNAPF